MGMPAAGNIHGKVPVRNLAVGQGEAHLVVFGIAFLVERYLTAEAASGLAASVSRVVGLSRRSGLDVQYLHSVYLPSDDTCFCMFPAPSADAVPHGPRRPTSPLTGSSTRS